MCSHVPILAVITIKNLPAYQQKHAVELQSSLHYSVRFLNKATFTVNILSSQGYKLTDKTVAKVCCTILRFSVNSNNTHYVLETVTRIQMT